MYEARQNKEKVSRRIDGEFEVQQKRQMNNKRIYIQNGIQNNNLNCLQLMLTRSQIHDITNKIYNMQDQLNNYNMYDQTLIAEHAQDIGFDISQCDSKLLDNINNRNLAAEENSDIDHPETSDAEEIPFVTPEEALQLKRGSGLSGPRTIDPFFQDGYYMRDSDGNIDFDQIYRYTIFNKSPVEPNSMVDLEEGSNNKKGFGVLLNGNIVHIPNASRSQHFSIANRIAKKHGQISGEGGHSPEGLTWHHLIDKYKMVLVNRIVHQKFGHNGGYYFW